MATQLQIRRGTSAQVAAFTGAEGEIVVNTTNDSVHVNDGSTAGGFEMARADLNNVSDTSLNAALTGNTVSALTITTLTLGATAITATGTELNLLDGVTATTAELNYVDGVTSAIQTQIDTKAPLASPTFTGTVTADGLTVDTDTLVVDATNNRVGIGNSSPSSYFSNASNLVVGGTTGANGMTISGSTDTQIFFADGTSGADAYRGIIRYSHADNGFSMWTDGTRRFDIDSSGNLLVGKTSTGINTAGHTIFASGEVFHTVAGTPLYVNRTGSDGSIQNFYKDGTTVGSIGTTTNSYLHVGGTNTGIFFYNNGFGPCAGSSGAGALNDGTKDIGASGNRFKDLYLSGDIAHKDAAGNARLLYDKSSNLLGNVGTNGTFATLSKSSGSFRIDHPLPAKTETHHLVHSFVEAPQADNIYRGKVELVDGSATVNIDTAAGMTEGTYVLLNTNTQCFTSNESGWTAIKGSVSGNTLTITAQDNTCTDTISWMVIGERHDQHMFDTSWTDENGKVIVEPLKENN